MVDTAVGLSVIACAGSPYDLGLAHGRATASLISKGITNWMAGIQATQPDVDKYLSRFLAETGFLRTIEQYTPALFDEMQGIADGSGRPIDQILAYNLMDEEWSFRVGRLDATAPGCTSVAIRGAAIGQTMDIPTAHDGTQVVLAIAPDIGSAKRVFTAAGMIGLNGANFDGVGVVVNNLAQSPSSMTGLPVSCVMREILEYRTAGEAAAWVKSIRHAVGQHYLIGDPNDVISLEAAANGVFPVEVGERYVHANHPLANPATRPETARMEEGSNTHKRSDRAEELVQSVSDQEGVERLLADREAPISCDRKAGFMTFGGTSIGLTAPPTMHVSPGPPHETPWFQVHWS